MKIKFQNEYHGLADLGYMQLVNLRYAMQTRQDQVKTMIGHTKRQIKLGHHDMYESLVNLESEARNLGRKVQIATTFFGIAKDRERSERHRIFENLFVNFAKQELTDVIWEAIAAQVREEMEKEE